MASRNIRRIIELILDPRSASKTERAMQEALKSGSDPSKSLRSLSTIERAIVRVRLGAVAAGVAVVGTITAGLRKIVGESGAAQKVHAQLEQAIKSTGGAARLSAKDLEDHAAALQKVTTFSDEAVAGAQALLLTFTKIRGDTFKSATETILDMSQALGQDLKTSALQVGKALNDPIKGITALQRQGVSFSAGQKEVIKNLAETNRLAEAQALILKELQVEFGGSARAARDTLPGALQALSNAWGELFEVSRQASGGIVRAINAITDALPKLRDALDKSVATGFTFWDQTKILFGATTRATGQMLEQIPILERWGAAWEKAGQAVLDATAKQAAWADRDRDMGKRGGSGGPPPPPPGGASDTLPALPGDIDSLLVDMGTIGQRRNAGFEAAREEMRNRAISLLGLAGVTQGAPEGRASQNFDALVDHFRTGFEDVESAAQTAALGIEHAFGDAFGELFKDGADFGSFMEAIFRGTAQAGLTAIAQYATGRVVEDVAKAFDERAAAASEVALAVSEPLLAAQHLAAAALHTSASHGWALSAAKWAVAGGVASGAAGAVGGGGGGGAGAFRGSDVTGRAIDKLDATQPIVNVYVDGIDPDNPAHVALMQRTVVNAREQWGDQKPTVRRYSGSAL